MDIKDGAKAHRGMTDAPQPPALCVDKDRDDNNNRGRNSRAHTCKTNQTNHASSPNDGPPISDVINVYTTDHLGQTTFSQYIRGTGYWSGPPVSSIPFLNTVHIKHSRQPGMIAMCQWANHDLVSKIREQAFPQWRQWLTHITPISGATTAATTIPSAQRSRRRAREDDGNDAQRDSQNKKSKEGKEYKEDQQGEGSKRNIKRRKTNNAS
ncbi:hypothetical protein F5Y16DRAFT_285161 [Xylariaceae sp. FL0255]|nr:hypothetical protein F5Y16DRAFT_285161 [Xylariaceae sp. FL0255]